MRIPDSTIQQIASTADIVQIISEHVTLKKAGKDYRGVCPFHGDKDPSFYVSPQKGIFHCFGCATGGSIFTFLMKIENLTFFEAVESLAKRYGIAIETQRGHSAKSDKDKILTALEIAQIYYVQNLKDNKSAGNYLLERGISAEWSFKLGLGFSPDSWDEIVNYLRAKKIDPRDAATAGLVRARESSGYYNYFRSRVTIPIRDLNGRIIAFGGRIFGEGDPKYLNSPESPVFRKRNTVFGLDSAREAIKSQGYVIIVEGYFDQISLRINGIENVVAPLGTALAPEQIKLLKRFTSDFVLIFDGDEAGLRAVKRAIPLFLAEGIEPRCLILTAHKDPDEAVRDIGPAEFRSMVENSGSTIDFFLDTIARNYELNSIHGRNLALEECIPVLREIADSKERDYLIERFSSQLRIREDRVRKVLQTGLSAQKRNRPGPKASLFDFPADERNVLRGMLVKEGFIDRVLESGIIKDIENPILHNLAELMTDFKQSNSFFDASAFAKSLEDEKTASLVAGWLQPKPEEDDLRPEVEGDTVLDESLDRIRLRKLEKRKTEIKERMKFCAPGGDEFNALAKELWAIGKHLRK